MLGQPSMNMPGACHYLHQFWTGTRLTGSSTYECIGDWVSHRWCKISSASRMRRFALLPPPGAHARACENHGSCDAGASMWLALLIFPSARMRVALSGVRARACARARIYMWWPAPCRHRARARACTIPQLARRARMCVVRGRPGFVARLRLRMACAGRASSSLDRPPPLPGHVRACVLFGARVRA